MEPVKVVKKPWGQEVWAAHTDKYALKIITINKGTRTSLQYHKQRSEHLYVQSGEIRADEEVNGKMLSFEYGPGEVIHNPPSKKHRLEALQNSVLIEVCTPELDDLVRVEDDFNR